MEWFMETDRCCTVDDDFTLISYHLSVFIWHTKSFDNKISVYRYHLLSCKLQKLLFPMHLFASLETLWFQYFSDPLILSFVSLFPDEHKYTSNIWKRSQTLFKHYFTNKSSASCQKNLLTLVKFFDFQIWFSLHLCLFYSLILIVF